MRDQIEQLLNEMRPAFARHGGNIEFVDFDDESGTVKVRLKGACRGCPMSLITLKAGVETTLVEQVPGVKEVISVE